MRTHMTVWTMGMGLLLVGSPAAGQIQAAPQAAVREAVAIPAPWMAQDPGDSLYTAARDALTRGDYRAAVRQFQALRDRYPRSAYVGDAHYWEAYAHSKLGSKDDLRTALRLLDTQADRYPKARTIGFQVLGLGRRNSGRQGEG